MTSITGPSGIEPKHSSLYIHIPFCSSRCHYCNFYFETGWSPRVLNSMLERSLDEARLARKYWKNFIPRTIYFGGGTPSIIPPAKLAAYLNDLWDIFEAGDTAQASIGSRAAPIIDELEFEANPESLTKELLETLISACHDRVRTLRLSIGVQTFDSAGLKVLGRRCSPGEARQALEMAHIVRSKLEASGANLTLRINADLMYAWPGQTRAVLEADCRELAGFDVDGISLYHLGIETGTPLEIRIRRGFIKAPDDRLQDELWDVALTKLSAAGYRNYEISNFARPGKESAHNFAYWHMRPWLGIGPGAVSTMPLPAQQITGASAHIPPEELHQSGPRSTRPARWENPGVFEYAKADLSPGSADREVEVLDGAQLFSEMFITGLRTIAGVSLSKIERIFGAPGLEAAAGLRKQWADMIVHRPGRIILKNEFRFEHDRLLLAVLEAAEPLKNSPVRWF